MRCFIAVQLSREAKLAVCDGANSSREALPQGYLKWIRCENLHITLRFLGSVSDSDLIQLATDLAFIERRAAFDLKLGRFGVFPNWFTPSVLWVGLEGDLTALCGLQAVIEAIAAPYSTHSEQGFNPHITVARFKAGKSEARELRDTVQAQVVQPVAWRVNGFDLMGSKLSSFGSTYTVLHHYSLQG